MQLPILSFQAKELEDDGAKQTISTVVGKFNALLFLNDYLKL